MTGFVQFDEVFQLHPFVLAFQIWRIEVFIRVLTMLLHHDVLLSVHLLCELFLGDELKDRVFVAQDHIV